MTFCKQIPAAATAGLNRRHFVVGTMASLTGSALAQTWPKGPIRIIVPHPAGGPADQIARLAANGMAQVLRATFVVENRPGGDGMLGAQAVAQAQPNGETLLVNASVHVTYPALFKKVGFDVIDDFAPVTQLTRVPMVLLVNPKLPVQDIKGLIAYAKAYPGTLSFGSSGNAGAAHLAGELFKQLADVDIVHVPYRGAAPALTDLIGGQIQLLFDSASGSLQHVRAGKLRALAVTSQSRMASLPDLPTMIEAGLPGYVLTNWYGLWAPKGTPAATIQRLQSAAVQMLHMPDVQAQLRQNGAEIVGSTPEEFARFLVAEKNAWAKIVVKSGAKLD
ncbi:Bug family tripartite tricarboxylate transporter substrate binding protein [Shinella sp.]|uniref:Bug family tripartite tricarboxylate transporter substrate binding protein n=1 Tax=Shinella sp. TaxID=1870904 RepID=UPI0039E6302C